MTCRKTLLWSCLVFIALARQVPLALARLRCFNTFGCEYKIGKGSECVDGECTNPYHRRGCLARHFDDHYKIRTCHSDDPPSAMEKGYCRPSYLGYTEVRVASQNWESAFVVAWILQIVLSEFLDVPVSIETGKAEAIFDFYDINTSFDYGAGNDWDAIKRASEVKDCRKLKESEEYLSCSHVVPETWNGHTATLTKLEEEEVIENPGVLGVLGEQMWFMRRSTATKYPSLLSFIGLQGDGNRPLLAEVFKRPTTWDDYCTFVSVKNCETPDQYAARAPTPLEEERGAYYVEGAYTSYFRATEQNNCENHTACTGHIVDYPCGWGSFVKQQAHYLDIAVESNGNEPSNGYTYNEMVQIWNAANATDSDVLMLWWRPHPLYQEYLGTDSEFLGVILPPQTQECVDHRIDPVYRCGDDPELKIGDSRGACADGSQSLLKVISTALSEISFEPDKPEALHSPAYDTIQNFRVSELQIGQVFDYWLQRDIDKYGLDLRDATCQWVVENIDILRPMIPRSHPRTIEDNDDIHEPGVIVLACIAIFATICGSILVVFLRNKKAIRYAQIEFQILLLIGLLLVSLGSLMSALPPSDQRCVAIGWLVNFGYTLELVPLIIKVAAINQMIIACEQMRRVKLRMTSLFGGVVCCCLIVGASLIVWTVHDPPRKDANLVLTDETSVSGEIIIQRVFYCGSNHKVWNFLGVVWQSLLLLYASIMAVQMRKLGENLNETRTLGVLIYTQTLLAIIRAITFVLEGSTTHAELAAVRSILYSVDVLTTLGIYFVPKFLSSDKNGTTREQLSTTPERQHRRSVHNWTFQQSLKPKKVHFEKHDADSVEQDSRRIPCCMGELRSATFSRPLDDKPTESEKEISEKTEHGSQ